MPLAPPEPAVLIVERDTDLATVQLQAEAALQAGRPVNVIVAVSGARTLLVRAVPRGPDVLMTSVIGSASVPLSGISAALRRHLDRASDLFEARRHERFA